MNLLNRLVKPLVVVGLGLAVMSCDLYGNYEIPESISVKNSITPSTIKMGNPVEWKVTVTNNGEKVKIFSASYNVTALNGSSSGYCYGSGSLTPLITREIPSHSTVIVYDELVPTPYTYNEDIIFENTVTIDCGGCSGTDACDYTVQPVLH
jgi:hypothetical protein